MSWSGSQIFRQFVADAFGNTAAFDLSGSGIDTFRAALYNNTITPDNDVSAANSAYNAGQWANTAEVSQVGQWAAAGVALSNPVINAGTADLVFFDADDTASGAAATLASVFGVLVYDDTLTTPVADQGVCFNYLGGTNSVTGGQFTVVWNVNGIWKITL